MDKYYFNYILEVDKPRLQKINEKFNTKEWIFSYFLNTKMLLNDTCILFVPKDMIPDEYRKSVEY